MDVKIALAGNPNCGKTTLFNALTGSNQYVGNWPGVTVEKKEGELKGHKNIIIQDLPGIYSLSPYTLEEVVARNYLVREKPDAILNIVDGTNIERNLYLTTQLIELGLPVVVAVNMMDLVTKNGDKIDMEKLGDALGCQVVQMSALKGDGSSAAARAAMRIAQDGKTGELPHVFTGSVEHALAHIEESIEGKVDQRYLRWYAIKVFERDEKVLEELALSDELKAHIEQHIADCETELDDDAESIITNQRYAYIARIVEKTVRKKAARHSLSTSDKIDRIVTNRIAALPVFAVIMVLIYTLAMGGTRLSIGTKATDWVNDNLFDAGFFISGGDGFDEAQEEFDMAQAIITAYEAGQDMAYLYDDESGETEEILLDETVYQEALSVEEPDPADYGTYISSIPDAVSALLEKIGCADWLKGLIVDGAIAGVGAVLGFVPQMLILFLFLSVLEDVGYMARVAFIMDRIFRKFGLSGKSFIPMLVGTGCGVPGVMASRTIENERDRRMTIMTTCFIPCGAKMPIIAMFAGALFGGNRALVATSAYFIGVAAIVISGIILKKTKAFAGEPSPFVMELPAYHIPSAGNVFRATWERGWSFVRRAGTVIFASSVILWFLQGFGNTSGGIAGAGYTFGLLDEGMNNYSILATIGGLIAWIFIPLGFGTWQSAVATITGLIAKENVVSTFAVLFSGGNFSANIAAAYTPLTAYTFMIFNLLCAPCFAAMGAIRREMNNARWTFAAIGYMCAFAYVISMIVYQLGGLIAGSVSLNLFTIVAGLMLLGLLYMLFRRGYRENTGHDISSVAAARNKS